MTEAQRKSDDLRRHGIAMVSRVLADGGTVYAMLTRVSASGMKRHVRLWVVYDGHLVEITSWAAQASGLRREEMGIVVRGVQFEAEFDVVDSLRVAMGWARLTRERM